MMAACPSRCLNVTYIKRDEGFESDGGESNKSDNDNAAGNNSNSVEEKIIKDHAVFVRDEFFTLEFIFQS